MTWIPKLITFIHMKLEVQGTVIRQEKEIKGIQTGKEEVKLGLFARWHDTYIENLRDIIKKWVETINEFSKAAGHRSNTKKFVAFLQSNSELSKRN